MDETLLLRQIPHSVEAEQSVLGAMLIDSRCIPDVVEALTGEDFYLKANREIYETIYTMFNFSATIDPVTVLDQMKLTGVYDENTSRNYILQLMEITPTAVNVGRYAKIVQEKAMLRGLGQGVHPHRQGQGPPPPDLRDRRGDDRPGPGGGRDRPDRPGSG